MAATYTLQVTFPDGTRREFDFEQQQTLHEVKTRIFAQYHDEFPLQTSANLALVLPGTNEVLKNNFVPFSSCHDVISAAIARGEKPHIVLQANEPQSSIRTGSVLSKIDELLQITEQIGKKEEVPAPNISTEVENDVLSSFDSLLESIQSPDGLLADDAALPAATPSSKVTHTRRMSILPTRQPSLSMYISNFLAQQQLSSTTVNISSPPVQETVETTNVKTDTTQTSANNAESEPTPKEQEQKQKETPPTPNTPTEQTASPTTGLTDTAAIIAPPRRTYIQDLEIAISDFEAQFAQITTSSDVSDTNPSREASVNTHPVPESSIPVSQTPESTSQSSSNEVAVQQPSPSATSRMSLFLSKDERSARRRTVILQPSVVDSINSAKEEPATPTSSVTTETASTVQPIQAAVSDNTPPANTPTAVSASSPTTETPSSNEPTTRRDTKRFSRVLTPLPDTIGRSATMPSLPSNDVKNSAGSASQSATPNGVSSAMIRTTAASVDGTRPSLLGAQRVAPPPVAVTQDDEDSSDSEDIQNSSDESDDDRPPTSEETISLGSAEKITEKAPQKVPEKIAERHSSESVRETIPRLTSKSSSSNLADSSTRKKKFRRAKKRTFDRDLDRRRFNTLLDESEESVRRFSGPELTPLETGYTWMVAKPVVFEDQLNEDYGKVRISIERMSLMQQAAFFSMLPDELLNYRLADEIASASPTLLSVLQRHSIAVKVHLRSSTPDGPTLTVSLECEGRDTIRSVKERAYAALQSAYPSVQLKPLAEYFLEFSDASVFLLDEDATLYRLSVTVAEQFDMWERSTLQQKKKFFIGIRELSRVAGLSMHWEAGQNEQAQFRRIASRNTGPLTRVTHQVAKITRAPLPPYMPEKFPVQIFLKETMSKAIYATPSMTVTQVIQEFAKKIPSPELLAQFENPTDWIFRVAGCSEYVVEDVPMHRIEYVRKCIERRKKIQFVLSRRPPELPKSDTLSRTRSNPDIKVDEKEPRKTIESAFHFSSTPRPRQHLAEKSLAEFRDEWLSMRPNERARFLKANGRRGELFHWPERPNTLPLWIVKKAFEIKVEKIESLLLPNTNFHPSTRMCVEIQLFYGGEPICHAKRTKLVPFSSTPIFDQVLSFKSLRVCNLPRETRICITVLAKEPKNTTPLAWVAFALFDYHDLMKSGQLEAWMWPNDRANPIGVCGSCLEMKQRGLNKLTMQLDRYYAPVLFTHPDDVVNVQISQQHRAASEKPPSSLAEEISVLIGKDPLWKPNEEEKLLLWRFRYYIRAKYPNALPKVALAVPWTNPRRVHEFYDLLEEWPYIPPHYALELLDSRYPDAKLRAYAVECLEPMTDEQLESFLLQLVQVLKYEAHHYSPLAQFLIDRALQNEVKIGVPLFWYLKAELHIPEITERFALILETFIAHCSVSFRHEIEKQINVLDTLHQLATYVKTLPLNKRTEALREKLDAGVTFPDTFTLPLNPTRPISGTIDSSKCKCFDSAKAPLLLCFKSADPVTSMEDSLIIYKSGDDLRQDALTLQMLNLMDQIWKSAGLDLHLTPYRVSVTGDGTGLIEVVLDSTTTAKIQKDAGGMTAVFKDTPLANWIRAENPKEEDFLRAVDNFTLSCAGYCVATYVLGIGDRHNDNIMIDKHGHLFHIDFGHFLGNFKSWKGIWNRERAPFVLTPEFAFVMGGKESDKFKHFVRLCCRAYNCVRKHANLFLNLFTMMLSTGIPELRSEEDLLYLHDALASEVSDEEAAEQFTQLIFESLSSKTTQINFAFHIFAH